MKRLFAMLMLSSLAAAVSFAQSSKTQGSSVPDANVTSMVGTWLGYVAWNCDSAPVQNNTTTWTFNSDGTWTYIDGGGNWIQIGGMVAWNFTGVAGLVYTANINRNAMNGIMGYAASGSTPGTGCFYAERTRPTTAGGTGGHDYSVGPLK